MKFVAGLTCHLCGATYPPKASWVCSDCLGPLEVTYDYDAVRKVISRELIESRPRSLWRYLELLPVEEPRTGFNSGFTPLVRATRLAEELGVSELYIKDDSVNHPTFSYKDRVVSVAATQGVELGFPVFGCASTGNLAGSVAAHAARLGLAVLRVHPARSRAGEDSRRGHLSAARRRRRRQLRRCESAVHADRGSIRLGIREHQPPQLLRRRREDDGLRDRRAAWLALSRSRRVAGGGRHAAAAHLQRAARVQGSRSRRRASAAHSRGAAGRIGAGHSRARGRTRIPGSGEAGHDREVARDWQSGRRLPGREGREGDRRQRRDGHATRRSSTPSSCSRAPKGSSPSRPAERRWRPRARSCTAA